MDVRRLNRFARRLAAACLVASLAAPAFAGQHATWPSNECVIEAAFAAHIPPIVLLGVLKVEGGHPGEIVHDANGSFDVGPMQINSLWLPRLKEVGITERTLADNGCLNLTVGAAILAMQLKNTSGNLSEAIGWYHSRTPRLAANYRRKVLHAIEGFNSD